MDCVLLNRIIVSMLKFLGAITEFCYVENGPVLRDTG